MNSRDDIKLTYDNKEEKVMSKEQAEALDARFNGLTKRIIEAESQATKAYQKVQSLKVEMENLKQQNIEIKKGVSEVSEVAYIAKNGLDQHTLVCDTNKIRDDERRKIKEEHNMTQTKMITDELKGIREEMKNQRVGADVKIKTVDDKYSGIYIKGLLWIASALLLGLIAAGGYIWTLKVGP